MFNPSPPGAGSWFTQNGGQMATTNSGGSGQSFTQQDWDNAISQMTQMYQQSAGMNRERLAAEIDNARKGRENAIQLARIQAETSRYGVDAQRETAMRQLQENARQFDAQLTETSRQFGLTFGENVRQFDLTLEEQVSARLQQAEEFRQQLEYQYGRAYADDWFRGQELQIAQEAHNLNQARLGLDYASTYAQMASNSADPWALADWQAGLSQTSTGQDIPVYMQRLAEGVAQPAFQAPAAGGGPGTMGMEGLMAQSGVQMPAPGGAGVGAAPGQMPPGAAYAPSSMQQQANAGGVVVPGGPPAAAIDGTVVAASSSPLMNAARTAMTDQGPMRSAQPIVAGPPPGYTYHEGQLVPIPRATGAAPVVTQYHEGQPVAFHTPTAQEQQDAAYSPQQRAILASAREQLQRGGGSVAPQAWETMSPLQQAQTKSTFERAGGRGSFDTWDWQRRQSRAGQSIGSR